MGNRFDTINNNLRLTGNSSSTAITGNLSVSGDLQPSTSFGFRNRIINGAMELNTRNAGTLTANTTTQYPVDRWTVVQVSDGAFNARATTNAPVGFTSALYFDVVTPDATLAATQYTNVQQKIEGFNVDDLAWGTANARTVTLSFWVRSSLTGTFSGRIANVDNTRAYPFTYTISVANTYEYKTITIPGDTTGTWNTDNTTGITVGFTIGSGTTFLGTANAWQAGNFVGATGTTSVIGTAGANFYITGVQLEVGSNATPFERRPYGLEFLLCQRYYQRVQPAGAGITASTTACDFTFHLPVVMRAGATLSLASPLVISDVVAADFTQSSINIVDGSGWATNDGTYAHIRFGNFTGLTNYRPYLWRNPGNPLQFNAEL